jgi:hypothetical protein
MHDAVEQRLAGEAAPRQQPGDEDAERQAARDAPERDAQAEPDGLELFVS